MSTETFTDRWEEEPSFDDDTDGELYDKHTADDLLIEAWDNDAVLIREDDPLHDILIALSVAFAEFDINIEELYRDLFISSATDGALDRHGETVGVRRHSGEEDGSYRQRVAAGYSSATSDTTFDTFAQVVLNVLLSSPTDTEISVDESTPTVIVNTQEEYIRDSPFNTDEITDLLRNSLPAGHDVIIETYGSFEFASDDYEPPNGTGFGEGTWGSVIN